MTPAGSHAPLVKIAGWGSEAQLVAAKDIEPGALVVGEYPVAFVETRPGEDELGPWLLLECVLSSRDVFERVSAADLKLTKWPLTPEDEDTLEDLARRYKRNPKKLAQLYHRIAANNIRYANAGVTGFGIWPTLSRSNHSCDPNAQLRAAKDRPLEELLLATRAIPEGAAICWNYYSEASFLALDWFERNARLQQNFQFLCRCARCESERPAQAAGLSNADLLALVQQARHPAPAATKN